MTSPAGILQGAPMIAWINVAVLVMASLLFLYFYMLSGQPGHP